MLFILLTYGSCKDNFSVDLANREFIRLSDQSISLSLGERYIIKTKIDSLRTGSQTLKWSVLNSDVASIEANEDHTAIITAKGEGETIIKVETADGNSKYFSEVSVKGDRVIKILAIGNSFSDDAIEHYLHDLAVADGHNVLISNMYIGGSSLEDHWNHALEDSAAYNLRVISPNGNHDAFNDVTLEEAISGENWDYISFQEVSQLSGIIDGYKEYLPKLLEYTRPLTSNPELKFVLHQTWAYASDSDHSGFVNYDRDQMKMYKAIVDVVWKAKELYDIDIVVPAGTAIQNGRTSYVGDKFTRDGYHLSLNMGRFTASATWFEAIFGRLSNNIFIPKNFSEYDVELVKDAAIKAVRMPEEVTILEGFQSPPPNDFAFTSPIFIDFGGVRSDGAFNHFGHPDDVKISGLKDEDGENTGFALEVSEPFTGALDRGLQNVLGWPKSVSQDMFFTDGINIPRSSFVASNLNKDKKYTFVFYGAINDDKTETEFIVVGKNQESVYLDNDNNLGKYVVVKDIEPSEDATIKITLSPGPNNDHFARFFGINAMVIVPSGANIPIAKSTFILEHPVYVDFGVLDAGAPFYYYEHASDDPHFDLKDDQGTNTGFAMNVTDRFTQRNESGALTNTLGWLTEITQDAFYGDKNNPTAGFTIYNLNKNQQYTFIFYGSRRDVNDNREANYLVRGSNEDSALLDASNNTSNVAEVKNIRPNSDGTVDIVISPGPNNDNGDKFYYINTLVITPVDYVLP